MVMRNKKLSISIQAALIKTMFPESKVITFYDRLLTWTHIISPSPLGDQYRVKLFYRLSARPDVFILSPMPLKLALSACRLPHVYDQKMQRLCLYYPDGKEWNGSMPLTRTIIPWTYEWLYHYELWLGSNGKWKGGGTHPEK